jgi:hypothetical protein
MLLIWGLAFLASWGCWGIAVWSNRTLLRASQQLRAADQTLKDANAELLAANQRLQALVQRR